MSDVLRLLRYNTGTDKQSFIKFKNDFDAVLFNATIVSHSGAAVSDLISVHKRQFIIDPQTHIFQHNISAIQDQKNKLIKKSILKYFSQLPSELCDVIINEQRPLVASDVSCRISDLVKAVFSFETDYVNSFSQKKGYKKYLDFLHIGLEPRLVIAPYFMLKKDYSISEMDDWLEINRVCLDEFRKINNEKYVLAAQIVMDKELLRSKDLIDKLRKVYGNSKYQYAFIWIDNFNSFDAIPIERRSFNDLLKMLGDIKIKPIMAYGGYDSILLCNEKIPSRLYGVAQSVGYGESREITPVGGGLPVNKYYFLPTHKRMKFSDAAKILNDKGYLSDQRSSSENADEYYKNICNCKQCREIIRNDINNFNEYNESIPFVIKKKHGDINRNRPTTNASLIAAMHFLFCKKDEWDKVLSSDLGTLIEELIYNISEYEPERVDLIKSWCDIYAK